MRLRPTALAFVLLFVVAAGAATLAAENPIGTAAMLDIGLGTRALGMGGAHIAVADDAAAAGSHSDSATPPPAQVEAMASVALSARVDRRQRGYGLAETRAVG